MKKKTIVARNYWKNLIDCYANVARIPNDHFVKSSKDRELSVELFELGKDTMNALRKYCLESSLSIEAVIDLAYAIILSKYSNEDDIIFGKTQKGMPLRVTFNWNYKFTELAAILEEQWNKSLQYENEYKPSVMYNTSVRNMLINSVIIWTDCDDEIELDEDERYSMYITVCEEDTLRLKIYFNSEIYERDTAKRIINMMLLIINQAINDRDIRIDEFEMTSASDRAMILNIFNDNAYEFDRDKSFVDHFREISAAKPDNVCVCDMYKCMTYSEVDKYTDKFAAYLIKRGVEEEDSVAVILDRTVYVPIAFVSVMKTGAAFFPIDRTNPNQRMKYLLEDSEAKFIVTTSDLVGEVSEYTDKRIVCIDDDRLVSGYRELDYDFVRDIRISRDKCAYRISTSGSTGRPKCISIRHEGFMNMCHYSVDYIHATEEDCCGVYLSFSFDAVIKQIFPYLMIGASVNIIPERYRDSEILLNSYCEEKKISILALPAIFAKLFIKSCPKSNIRVLQAGGDRLKGYIKRDYEIYNEYGPAEFTVLATSFKVDRNCEVIPVGKTIYNTYAYVLDKYDKLCPVGVPGELCLSGVQISNGYMNREDLNEVSFVKNPFCVDEYTRMMYRTGDLCRFNSDGTIDMIGRMDSQVKIDGLRIELFGIEYFINVVPGVKSSACIMREDDKGKNYLEAYIVPYEDDFDTEEVMKYLRLNLPPYMIPRYITKLCAIPVTPIGKVDKKALPYAEPLDDPGEE